MVNNTRKKTGQKKTWEKIDMFGIGEIMDSVEKMDRRRKVVTPEKLEELATDWDPNVKFSRGRLVVRPETMPDLRLFDYKEAPIVPPNAWMGKGTLGEDLPGIVLSPSKKFMYANKAYRAGTMMQWYGNGGRFRQANRWDDGTAPPMGEVRFAGEYVVPLLHERLKTEIFKGMVHYQENPWMSITPNELLTLRPSIKASKGHTVIAGLGLGWCLTETAKRKQVKQITLVEREPELVEWLLPRILAKMEPEHAAKVTTVTGDAWEVLPTLTADYAAIDIYPGMGWNSIDDKPKWVKACPNIQKIWVWA